MVKRQFQLFLTRAHNSLRNPRHPPMEGAILISMASRTCLHRFRVTHTARFHLIPDRSVVNAKDLGNSQLLLALPRCFAAGPFSRQKIVLLR
jgi:hypothetical protein